MCGVATVQKFTGATSLKKPRWWRILRIGEHDGKAGRGWLSPNKVARHQASEAVPCRGEPSDFESFFLKLFHLVRNLQFASSESPDEEMIEK